MCCAGFALTAILWIPQKEALICSFWKEASLYVNPFFSMGSTLQTSTGTGLLPCMLCIQCLVRVAAALLWKLFSLSQERLQQPKWVYLALYRLHSGARIGIQHIIRSHPAFHSHCPSPYCPPPTFLLSHSVLSLLLHLPHPLRPLITTSWHTSVQQHNMRARSFKLVLWHVCDFSRLAQGTCTGPVQSEDGAVSLIRLSYFA